MPLFRFGNVAILSIAGWLARETEVWEKGGRRGGREGKVGRGKREGEVGCMRRTIEAAKLRYTTDMPLRGNHTLTSLCMLASSRE